VTQQFLIHHLAEIYLAVDITGIGMKSKFAPLAQYLSWKEAHDYFVSIGATEEALAIAKRSLDETGHANLLLTKD